MADKTKEQEQNIYKRLRGDMSREKASELLEAIPPERIERIENGKSIARPEEVLIMSKKYHAPELCNYYCAHECAIGNRYVPEVNTENLSRIILEMVNSLNSVSHKQERLIEITVDGKISADEMPDFLDIQQKLETISMTVEALQLWVEKANSLNETE